MAEITDFGPRKTFFILAIVFGCFTVLWPKILHPMFIGFVTPHHSVSDESGKTPKFSTPKIINNVRKIAGSTLLEVLLGILYFFCIKRIAALDFHIIELNR